MRKTVDGLELIKTCPNCDALIQVAEKSCKFCGYLYQPTILSEEEVAWTYEQTVEMINDAFFRLENYGAGNSNQYEGFDFGRMFSVLFEKTKLPKNQTIKNFNRIQGYYSLTGQLAYDFDKSIFENTAAYKNEDFMEDLGDICYINSGRYWEFLEFETPNKKDRMSITDLMEEEIVFEEASEEPHNYKRELSVNDHFERIRSCEITELERYNLAQILTDNFDLDKLRLLYKDLDFYLFVEKEDMESRFSEKEIVEAMENWSRKGMAIPTIDIPVLKKMGKPLDPEDKPKKVVDLEALLFSAEFFCCYQFKGMLKAKIHEAERLLGIPTEAKDTARMDTLKKELTVLGFFDLPKIDGMLPRQQQQVLGFLTTKEIPHAIALLDQLGLPDHIRKTQTKTKTDLHKKLARVLGCPERAVKGNLNVLNELSREDRTRYTAHLHLATTQKFLTDLK